MPSCWLEVGLITWLSITTSLCYEPHKNSYCLRLESSEGVAGDKETLVDFAQIRIIGRERKINGTVIVKEDIDNIHYNASLTLYSADGSQWKEMPYSIPPTKACDFAKGYCKTYVASSLQDSKFSIEKCDICPIPKFEYSIKNLVVSTDNWVSFVPRGIKKAVLHVRKDNILVGGFIIIVNVLDC